MAWVGSANNMKWVGCEFDGLFGLIKMDPCPRLL